MAESVTYFRKGICLVERVFYCIFWQTNQCNAMFDKQIIELAFWNTFEFNIQDWILNWISNWIIFWPDLTFDWIIKTYQTGLAGFGGKGQPSLVQTKFLLKDHTPGIVPENYDIIGRLSNKYI